MLDTVTWGGDPNKPVTTVDGEVRFFPCKSFEVWQEMSVRLHSIKWEDGDVDAARDLRIATLTLIVDGKCNAPSGVTDNPLAT